MLTRKSEDLLECSVRLGSSTGVDRAPGQGLNTFAYVLFILILLFGVNIELGE
jgi:hypothetical protein